MRSCVPTFWQKKDCVERARLRLEIFYPEQEESYRDVLRHVLDSYSCRADWARQAVFGILNDLPLRSPDKKMNAFIARELLLQTLQVFRKRYLDEDYLADMAWADATDGHFDAFISEQSREYDGSPEKKAEDDDEVSFVERTAYDEQAPVSETPPRPALVEFVDGLVAACHQAAPPLCAGLRRSKVRDNMKAVIGDLYALAHMLSVGYDDESHQQV